MAGMEDLRGEGGESWRLDERSRPPLLGELVERIDEALATARASEAAVMTVGVAALDAAEQAQRAADMAERASRVALAAVPAQPVPAGGPRIARPPAASGDLGDFSARADRIAERLQRLQRVPLSA
jgi:hypothetical protein